MASQHGTVLLASRGAHLTLKTHAPFSLKPVYTLKPSPMTVGLLLIYGSTEGRRMQPVPGCGGMHLSDPGAEGGIIGEEEKKYPFLSYLSWTRKSAKKLQRGEQWVAN